MNAQGPAFPAVWVNDAVLETNTRPLVKGLIDSGSFVLIYGPSGSGKSFFTADLAQHITTGSAWRGRRVQQSLVVYIASEAGSSILRRFIAWRDNRLSEIATRVPLAILTRGPNLLVDVQMENLIDQLKALQQEAQLPLGATINDTLSRSMPGGDENSTQDMTVSVRSGDRIRDEFGCSNWYVHHTGKDPAKGARGNYALTAAADVIMRVENKVATVEKVRDGVEGESFPFSLEPVEVGLDVDGDSIMTCLLNASDTMAMPRERMPTGRNQRIVLPVVREVAAERNNRSPGTSAIPKGVLLVSMNEVIERAHPKFGGDDPAFRVREKIKDAILGLQAARFVGVHGDLVWLL